MSEAQPLPIRHATDREKLRRAEREVRRRLSPERRRQALALSSRRERLALRLGRRGRGSPEIFMPRDAYLSLVQSALEQRLELARVSQAPAPSAPNAAGPQAADGSSLAVGDQLFERFGPDDFGWMTTAVEDVLTSLDGGRHSFGTAPVEYRLGERVRLVLLADWGTGTPRARHIAELARQRLNADATVERHAIHLGDVYYCGLPSEYETRFLNDWPATNAVRSWNLNGNHDMYSGGQGYFNVISTDAFKQQGTSVFRLFNDHWQFIALDTAYADNDLYDGQLPWVNRWVEEADEAPSESAPRCRTVLLSHHQLGSARAQKSVGPGIREKTAQLREAGRIHAWFWGHEHRCFIYEPYLGVACPVCLGNGGVPELLSQQLTLAGAFGWITGLITDVISWFRPRAAPPAISYQPPAPDVDEDGLKWEKLGFVVVDIDGPSGRAVYVDEDDTEVPIAGFAPDVTG